jgi:hypothetical protein
VEQALYSAIRNWKMMGRDYKVAAKKTDHTIDKVASDDLTHVAIEKARAGSSWSLLLISIGTLAVYRWPAHVHAHPSIPLILQRAMG